MLNDLLQRADRALAENKTLVEELQKSVRRARELDDNLQYLHWLRIEDERRQSEGLHRTQGPAASPHLA
jgi:hypothetical protein